MENICSLDDGTESESERVNRESGRLADMGHCRSPNYFVRCGACVCVYVCACVPVYLCVCVYCIGAEAAHAYLLVTHTQPAQRETDAETPAANFLIKDPLPYSRYIGFNPFPRLAPPNVTVQSLLPPPPASAQTPPAHCLSTSIFRPQRAPTVEPNNFWPICLQFASSLPPSPSPSSSSSSLSPPPGMQLNACTGSAPEMKASPYFVKRLFAQSIISFPLSLELLKHRSL